MFSATSTRKNIEYTLRRYKKEFFATKLFPVEFSPTKEKDGQSLTSESAGEEGGGISANVRV